MVWGCCHRGRRAPTTADRDLTRLRGLLVTWLPARVSRLVCHDDGRAPVVRGDRSGAVRSVLRAGRGQVRTPRLRARHCGQAGARQGPAQRRDRAAHRVHRARGARSGAGGGRSTGLDRRAGRRGRPQPGYRRGLPAWAGDAPDRRPAPHRGPPNPIRPSPRLDSHMETPPGRARS
ncbi:hypothetical protein Ae168Ps1_6279 [Pseudonocardia sp. Ae168_Ps1]|nr:hypothetical protein Ae168Ps1_6276 [Pseudonocardia sp. Ae168_Ps1]OLL70313.1 hypothetical protein Ae168Ps1_6279 [Pseudonocardia sp. Ae168_Ps1]